MTFGASSRHSCTVFLWLVLSTASVSTLVSAIPFPNGDISNDDTGSGGGSGGGSHDDPCELWLAPSQRVPSKLNLYTGIALQEGQQIGAPEQVISVIDMNADLLTRPLRDVLWDTTNNNDALSLHSWFRSSHFVTGMGGTVLCSQDAANVRGIQAEGSGSTGVHRSRDPSNGAFGVNDNFQFRSTQALSAGSELFLECHMERAGSSPTDTIHEMSLRWLQDHGTCVDGIHVKDSTIPKIGRGAFAKRRFVEGQRVTTSPVVIIDREQTLIMDQAVDHKKARIQYNTDKVIDEQLLLNYCFEMVGLDALLLPTGPGVSFINHGGNEANAALRWSEVTSSSSSPFLLQTTTANALNGSLSHAMRTTKRGRQLLVEIIATKDIGIGEEIMLNYGAAWDAAWKAYASHWAPEDDDYNYTTASAYRKQLLQHGNATHSHHIHGTRIIRTLQEQEKEPYAQSMSTACYYRHADSNANNTANNRSWMEINDDCLRPCGVLDRKWRDGKIFFAVRLYAAANYMIFKKCPIPGASVKVDWVPAEKVVLTDQSYTLDEYEEGKFRYPMALPRQLIPASWQDQTNDDLNSMGDFVQPDLKPGELSNIYWKGGGASSSDGGINHTVMSNAYLLGVPHRLRQVLLKYCEYMGIAERLRNATIQGNAVHTDDENKLQIRGQDWYIQRPGKKWMSNMHWVSPLNEESHQDYLTALSAGGFDDILNAIGTYFGMDGLAAYQITFIGVSHCIRGFMHYDVHKTGSRAFNIIIPLILANGTQPELLLRNAANTSRVGKFRYRYNIATMMGDNAHHATAAADYRSTQQMRLAATVYVADIQKDNVKSLMQDYTQEYPPRNRSDWLLAMAGKHWKSEDADDITRLPTPDAGWLSRVLGE